MTVPFTKPATTYAQQVALLQARGMAVANPAQAELWLENINYYRLSAYWLPFEASHATHRFVAGTQFDTVLGVYFADRELRLLFLDAIERIEISFRAHWAFQLAHLHGPHAHLDKQLATDHAIWMRDIQRLMQEVGRSKEVFIRHMTDTYQEMLPPVWAVCEVMSLGLLSSWYGNLKPVATRAAIASALQVHHDTLASWLQHLSIVRNLCAHHSRLWNRAMTVTPAVPRTHPASLRGEFVTVGQDSRKLYNTALLTLHLMDVVAPASRWRQSLVALLTRGELSPVHMGFPANWQTRTIWR